MDYANVFSTDLAIELPEHLGINENTIELIESQQPCHESIYRLSPIEQETLKVYLETDLKTEFTRPSKSFACISILFSKKSNKNLRLCINDQKFYNLTIKYLYSLPLISKFLDWLDCAKQYT